MTIRNEILFLDDQSLKWHDYLLSSKEKKNLRIHFFDHQTEACALPANEA
jgi:hypothetical protein